MANFLFWFCAVVLNVEVPRGVISRHIIILAGQSPLWTRNKETRTSLNSVRRKPQRRVPITAPPPVASSSTTFSSGDTSTAVMMTMTTSEEELTSPATPISTFSYTFLPKISTSTVKTILGCGSVVKRGIAWPFTPAGSVSVKTTVDFNLNVTYFHKTAPQCLKITQNVAFELLNFDMFRQFLSCLN